MLPDLCRPVSPVLRMPVLRCVTIVRSVPSVKENAAIVRIVRRVHQIARIAVRSHQTRIQAAATIQTVPALEMTTVRQMGNQVPLAPAKAMLPAPAAKAVTAHMNKTAQQHRRKKRRDSTGESSDGGTQDV